MSVLDYLSDFICVLYGVPGAYGVVTMPFSVREGITLSFFFLSKESTNYLIKFYLGINIFLDGMIPTENLRFREDSLTFRLMETAEDREEAKATRRYNYPAMQKTLGIHYF